MSSKYTLVLVRHGESEWNQKNLFCGWHDADLSETGINEAKYAVEIWRRSYDVPPPALTPSDKEWSGNDPRYVDLDPRMIPACECLKDTVARVLPFWTDSIAPAIKSGKKVIVAAHGNSLRALVKYLDNISDSDIMELNIPTGIPLAYELDKDLKPVKNYYLASEEEVKAAQERVANQGKAKLLAPYMKPARSAVYRPNYKDKKVLILLLITIALASVGKSLGIRRRYVALLLRVFEYIGTKLVDQQENEEDEESDIEEEKVNQEQIIETESSIGETELESWNLLTRSNKGYPLTKNIRLTVLWCIGFFVRYVLLFPFRLALAIIGILWLIVSTAFIGYLPPSRFKRCLNQYATLMCFRLLARSCSAVITFHNEQNKAKNGIVVANHTSPIDVIVLSCDNCYAMVGQAQGGLLGVLQRAMGRATAHVWFERSEMKDRHLVAKRLKEHVQDASKLPMLIFPEGTCINNTSVMMFKKGSFEVATTIYPVAIKYDLRFGDAFWDSSKHGMVSHLFNILTSWALVCDIWYLQPMVKTEREDAVEFANRVKREIAQQGGLVDLDWDGQLKRMQAKEAWKKKPQEQYSNMLKVE
ncbi:hypothetical protein C0Q70_10348 [Pomacea canaliculata]|uniref:Phosphoglycerate mutase n=1 Tax=Pomacea canaliculata TaxID=400727 RepID=A0A2T7PCD6_POMCA|nr:hypothetical protein C0Q70_10348 [Pomacea canaliculata]